jgi:uncharacterized protein (TIGR00369 family)
MKPLNPTWVESIKKTADLCPYFELLGMRIADLTPGESRLEIEVAQKHLQPFGVVHGGVFATLIDAAGWWAAYTLLEDGLGMTTLEMKLNFLAPASSGRMIGSGRAVKMGRQIGLAEAGIRDMAGKLLAHGTVTCMTVAGLSMSDQENAPPKFL